MTENIKFIWRCAKCSNHFSSIVKTEGIIKQEKKCPKCKSLNLLTLTNDEIIIHCKMFNRDINSYEREINENYPYP